MEETVYDITLKIRQRKIMRTNSKDDIEGSFDKKTKRKNVVCNFLNTHLSQFYRNSEGMFDKGNYKKTIKNCTLLVLSINNLNLLIYLF